MKAPPFVYQRAATLADAFRMMSAAGPDARLLAGGQSLMATLAFRLSEPSTLIDISRIVELKGISDAGDKVRVGALTTHAELGASALIKSHVPLVAQAVPLIAHPAIRNRGTIGGSIAFADPAAELPAVAVALEADIAVATAQGERRVPAAEFFKGLYETALAPGEMITAVEFPKATSSESSIILELARRSGDYAMAGIVIRIRIEEAKVSHPRITGFALGDTPVLCTTAMAKLAGVRITNDSIRAVCEALDEDLDPSPDMHGSPAMKTRWARVLLERALKQIAGMTEKAAA